MKYAVTSQEMKIYDRNTSEYFGIPSIVLMERASLEVIKVIEEHTRGKRADRKLRALVFAGVGNNGGDGACVARLLRQKGYLVNLCVIGDYTKCSDLLLTQLKVLEKYGTVTDTFSNIRDNKSAYEWDIIVDALFGIGLSRPVAGDYAEAIDYINGCKESKQSDLFIVSVDMPSGINADNGQVCQKAVKADCTVTFNQVKLGQILYPGCEYAGEVVVADAGITDESFLGKEPSAFYYDMPAGDIIPQRKKDGNKSTCGKLLVVAGSKLVSGACILCAQAAFKAGAGMVRVFTARENSEAVKTLLPEAMLTAYDAEKPYAKDLAAAMEWSSAAVVGPGMGTGPESGEILRKLLSEYDKDMVLDADALTLIATNPDLRKLAENYAVNGKKLIITPHLGEFSRLFGQDVKACKEHLLEYPIKLAKALHCTVVCKDARTIVADSAVKKIYVNISGNDGMATAGSGDVLTGILGALLAYRLSSFETACIGVYLHGLAGDAAELSVGRYSMTASDIIEGVKNVIKDGT